MIHVVAGAVTRPDGRILIAERPVGKVLAGAWEFPGGKLEAGEARATGLARELEEELGIRIRNPRPLLRARHTYPHGEVLIDMWVVSRFEGTPRGADGQALKWCTHDELLRAELLPADRPIVRALALPERLLAAVTAVTRIGDGRGGNDSMLRGTRCRAPTEALRAAERGADFVAMDCELTPLQVTGLCDAIPIPVFVRDLELELAWSVGATGVNALDCASFETYARYGTT